MKENLIQEEFDEQYQGIEDEDLFQGIQIPEANLVDADKEPPETFDYQDLEEEPIPENDALDANEPMNVDAKKAKYNAYVQNMEGLGQDWSNGLTKFTTMFIPTLSDDDQAYLKYDPMMDPDNYESPEYIKNVANRAYEGEDGPEIGETVRSMSGTVDPKIVLNQNGFQQLKGKMEKYVKKVEGFLPMALLDTSDELGSDLANSFIQANSMGGIKRMLRGHTPTYMLMKTPLGETVEALAGAVNANLDEQVIERLKKNEAKYPYVTMVCGAEKHLMTMSDYWHEKKKNNGNLSTERELQYRQMLYDQARILIPLVDKTTKAAIDDKTNEEIRESGLHSQGNEDPFHNCLYASRGSLQLRCSLEANRDGIENGWQIDDLGILGTFRFIQKAGVNAIKYPGENMTLEAYNKAKENPLKGNEEYKKFLARMEQLYQKIKKTPLQDERQRRIFLKQMKKMVKDGNEKTYTNAQNEEVKFIDNEKAKYFNQLYDNMLSREYLIETGKQSGIFTTPVQKDVRNVDNEVNMRMVDFATKRSFIFLGRESDLHKKLRQAVSDLKQMELDRKDPNKKASFSGSKYLNKLDEIIYCSKMYQMDKKKAKTPAGKKRLEGAREYEQMAKELRDRMVKDKEGKDRTALLADLRQKSAIKIAEDAAKELASLKLQSEEGRALTKTEKSQIKTRAMELGADILVARYSSSLDRDLQKVFYHKGANVLKKEILASREYNRLMSGYFRQEKAFGDIAKDLGKEEILQNLETFNRGQKNQLQDYNIKISEGKTEVFRKNDEVGKVKAPERVMH